MGKLIPNPVALIQKENRAKNCRSTIMAKCPGRPGESREDRDGKREELDDTAMEKSAASPKSAGKTPAAGRLLCWGGGVNELGFDLALFAASALAGMLGALIGLGGGIIITPLLVLGFGIDIRYAMGAALASVIATSSGAAAAYLRDGLSNLRIGLFFCVATTLGAVGGAMLAGVADAGLLSLIFGLALLATSGLSLRKIPDGGAALPVNPVAARLRLDDAMPTAEGPRPYHVQHVGWGFFVMTIAGLLSGLLGIGSGAFKVLGMDQIMRIPFRVTTATSNFMIGVTAAASIGIYLKNGYLDPVLVAPAALGVLGGAFVGAKLLPVVPVRLLKIVFLSAITAIGIQMILRGLNLSAA